MGTTGRESGWDERAERGREASRSRVRRFLRVTAPLAAAGALVGVVVSAMAASIGLASCGPREALIPFDPASGCHDLVLSLSARTGLAAGVVTVFSALFVMGLSRTADHLRDERYRRVVDGARRRRDR
ncbi:MAG: hypothetical protein HY658_06445 [Actinobacteria bacterium]|nr:hypothetical protein [Actinomycetota bacterium]